MTPDPTFDWLTQLKTARCDRGWTVGERFCGCEKPGIRRINGEWVCAEHTQLTSISPDRPTRVEIQDSFLWLVDWVTAGDRWQRGDGEVGEAIEAYRVLGHDAYQIILAGTRAAA